MRKKLTAVGLSAIMALSVLAFAGCGAVGDEEEPIDPTRTQLYVSNFNGGYGDEWLRKVKARFEEMQKDVSYEDGKKGVQIMIHNNKEGVFATMGITTEEVFFTEKVNYGDYVSEKFLLDITDIVTEPLSEYGEEGTIEDKFTDVQKNYLKMEGKYYAIPHYEGYSGINYDIDLFEDYGFYFKDGGGFVTDGMNLSERSAGPDGEKGTWDDGLPVTYEEFFALCDRIYQNGIVPVSWTGANQHYINTVATALHADYEGLEQMMLNYTFDGTATDLISVDEATEEVTELPDVQIDEENGYELYSQAGRYYALKFVEKLVSTSNYYSTGSFNLAQSHMGAQEDFLYGRFSSSKPRIAMLLEGIWWQNEAKGIVADMVATYGERASMENRRFGFMPFPKANENAHPGLTLYDNMNSLSFINARIPEYKIPLAKKFLQFCATDESIIEFMQETNTPKALRFEMTEEEKSALSYYGRQVLEMREEADIVYPNSTTNLFLNNTSSFIVHTQQWLTSANDIYPSKALRPEDGGKSAETYFRQLREGAETRWVNLNR